MKLEEKLKKKQYREIWEEYCGFLDLSIEDYMSIQKRLMLEQIGKWSASGLGQKLLRGRRPATIEEFRKALPLTTYEDYADILLSKRVDMLPEAPVLWLETTWEGGKRPIKTAPYTKSMLETFKSNVISCMLLCTSNGKGHFNLKGRDKILYGLAPLPYTTGVLPLLLDEEFPLEFMPPVKNAQQMSFGQRNKRGFQMGLKKGIDLFFGVSSVANYISGCLDAARSKSGSGFTLKSIFEYSPKMLVRYLSALYRSKRDHTPLKPKDIFKLRGFVCAGTDSKYYKDSLEDYWGIRPLEIMAGTEPACVGVENWEKNGLYFYPDSSFYEFIPEAEMYKSLDDPTYQPATYLMDELIADETYELVISVFKGGAFARYRVGDLFRCMGYRVEDGVKKLPRMVFVDRVPNVIDIAAFTRITENSIKDVISLSKLGISDWFAMKEYDIANKPFLHLFVEMSEDSLASDAVSKQIINDHLSVYFNYFDSDYYDLKDLLGIDPLKITMLRTGTMHEFARRNGRPIRRMNPSRNDVISLMKIEGSLQDLKSGVM